MHQIDRLKTGKYIFYNPINIENIRLSMKSLVTLIHIFLFTFANSVNAVDICSVVNGSIIIGQDSKNTILGKITNSYDSDSIFNELGNYGNEFSPNSIWNEFSEFGNEFNAYSPFNEFSSKPPMIIKNGKIIGYLTTNKYMFKASIAPNLLKALCQDNL